MSTPVKAKPFKRKIIVRRIRKQVREQPRGAWKIAYADFVTALMAFFLMLWLLSSTSADYRNAISEYFETPLMVVFSGGQSNDVTSSLIIGGYGEDKTLASGQVSKGAVEDIAITATNAGRLLHMQEVVRLK